MNGEPIEVIVVGTPVVIPAGPRTKKVKDRWGRRTVEVVTGYVSQPYIRVYTDPGGTRMLEVHEFTVK